MILTSGLVPRTAVGASLAVDPDALRAFHPSFGALLVPNTRAVDGLTSYGLTAAWAGACGRLGGDAAVHAGACVNALIGVVHAIVHAAEPIDPGDRLWVAASAQGRFGARIVGPFRFDAGLEVLFPLRHQAFRVGGAADDLAFQQRILALAAWIGLAWSFQ